MGKYPLFSPNITKSSQSTRTLHSQSIDDVRVIGIRMRHSKPCIDYTLQRYAVRFGRPETTMSHNLPHPLKIRTLLHRSSRLANQFFGPVVMTGESYHSFIIIISYIHYLIIHSACAFHVLLTTSSLPNLDLPSYSYSLTGHGYGPA